MKHSLTFLRNLAQNNTREWFKDHKKDYDIAKDEFEDLVMAIQDEIQSHDVLLTDRTKIFRIHRDVRFSNDKTPYNTDFRASFKRAGDERRGGYYFRVAPGESALVGGFFGPEPKDMLHIRKQIQQEPERLQDILNDKEFKSYFGELKGEQVKSAPRGFSKDDPAIDLIRFKQLMVRRDFTDKEVLSPSFAQNVSEGYSNMRPFFDYMSEILTTDLNGVSLIG